MWQEAPEYLRLQAFPVSRQIALSREFPRDWETIELLRKEVIHPHLPVGIPCYDLVFIANLALEPR